MARRRKRSKSIPRTHYLYDAFPTRSGAKGAVGPLRSCAAIVRKLTPAQDGGRLKYGVYVRRDCKL